MSELKAYTFSAMERTGLADYYLKSEADKVIAHQKYKRCLAMAQEWRSYATFCGMQSSCHNHRGFGKTAEKWTWKEFHAWKCVKRWLALAEKFKEAKGCAGFASPKSIKSFPTQESSLRCHKILK